MTALPHLDTQPPHVGPHQKDCQTMPTPTDQPAPLKLSRTFHAPRATVFKAWSSAEHVSRWFAPEPLTVPEAKVEMRVGGAFEVCMRMPTGEEHWSRGTFLEVEPEMRLVIDMQACGADGRPAFRALTEVVFSDALGGTRMDVTQSYTLIDPVAAAPMIGGASQGWASTLQNLEREVIRMQGGAETIARSVVHAIFHLERTYDAPVARVWAALTEETAKAKWFGGSPREWEVLERVMDVRPGGRERAKGRWASGLVTCFDAIYFDVIPLQRLVYAYEMHMNEKKISVSLATMQLTAKGAKTTLAVTEQGAFLDGYDDAGSREQGTGFLLDAIGASLND
ncbi:MAG: SRPBCC domain-containing protein [Caulobacteraceae bacterium]|nr:SRPBCC domain-containing protein [Caulobacteraceae bacterium]